MQNLEIEEDAESLAVSLQATGKLTFSGRSFPEDSQEFFSPIMEWLDVYKSNPGFKTLAHFDISYFPTNNNAP